MFDSLNLWVLERVAGLKKEEGQTFAEYALILAIVVLVAMVALTPLGIAIRDRIQDVANAL